jgi:hypothetical protein
MVRNPLRVFVCRNCIEGEKKPSGIKPDVVAFVISDWSFCNKDSALVSTPDSRFFVLGIVVPCVVIVHETSVTGIKLVPLATVFIVSEDRLVVNCTAR